MWLILALQGWSLPLLPQPRPLLIPKPRLCSTGPSSFTLSAARGATSISACIDLGTSEAHVGDLTEMGSAASHTCFWI